MALPVLNSLSNPGGLWRGDALQVEGGRVLGSGHAALDAELPGGGWPLGAMSEVLPASAETQPDAHVWQLLLPALAQAVAEGGGLVLLVGAPHAPFGPALAAAGLPSDKLLWVRTDAPAARLWSTAQALRCAEVAAVLAWLPQARASELRRLQVAAAQQQALFFVFRPAAAAQSASPARLRLQLQTQASTVAGEAAQLLVHVLKRRGPPLQQPVVLPAHGERLMALLAASELRRQQRAQAQAARSAVVLQLDARRKGPAPTPAPNGELVHALDRLAVG